MARGSISAAAACATAGLLLAVGASGATGAPISEGRALAQASPPIRDDDVIVSPEYAVADAVPSARRRTDEDPAVAWNGSEYLVVFTDSPIFTGDDDVYGMRLDADGNPLDPAAFPIAKRAEDQSFPDVAWDGENFLVVYEDSSLEGINHDIFATRVTSAGDILDPDGFPISTAEGYQWGPSLAWDGTNYLVAWTDERDEGSIYGARVSPDTTVLDPEGIQISFYHDYEAFTSVAWSGTEYLVVWADARHSSSTYAARVTPGGAVLDPDGILVSQWGHYDYTGVAWNGGSFLVAWDDERDLQTRNDVYAARVAEDGTVLDPSGIGVVTEEGMESSPDVVAGEGSALVAWDAVGAGGARIDPAGNVLDPDGIEISTAPGVDGAAVASNGADFFAAWRDTRLGSSLGWKVFGARIQGDGTVLDPEGILISTSANQQGDASVAWDGEHYFVVWADYRPGRPAPDYGIYGARLTADGESLDGTGILLSSAENAQRPHVAWDGTVFLVTWEQWGSTECAICATRVTSSGEVLDPDGLSLSDHLFDSHAVVAASPESFLVGWYRSSTPSSLVVGRVTSSGVVLDPAGIVVGTGGGTSSDPSVAWSGESYLLAWHRQNDIYGGRVAADGTVLDPEVCRSRQLPRHRTTQAWPGAARCFSSPGWISATTPTVTHTRLA